MVKRQAVSSEVFIRKLHESNGKKTAQQCADELGMSIESFQQRLIALRKLAKASGQIAAFPKLLDGRKGSGARKGKKAGTIALELLAQLQAEDVRDSELNSAPELDKVSSSQDME